MNGHRARQGKGDAEEIPPDALRRSAQIIRDFIEDYHEQLEERWVFPRFEAATQELDLVGVLRRQHRQGRLLTDSVLALSAPHEFADPAKRMQLAEACARFVHMYRPHEAREGTVLFPALRRIVTPNEFDALGEQFEREERRRFGSEGFGRVVASVSEIEKTLGIYDLAQFTPLPLSPTQ